MEDLPDVAYLVKQLERLDAGESGILDSVRRREARARNHPCTSKSHVELVHDASESAAVVEVRTGDRARLLYALGHTLSEAKPSIRSAHVSTLAGQAIDTFYVTDADGSSPSMERSREPLLRHRGRRITAEHGAEP